MSSASIASRSSRFNGWVAVVLGAIVAVVAAALLLSGQFQPRQTARDLAAAAAERLTRRPPPHPYYRQVAPAAPAEAPADAR